MKRAMSLILFISLVAGLLLAGSFSVFASGAQNSIIAKIGTSKGAVGDTVNIPISFNGIPTGINNCDFRVSFDRNIVDLVSVDAGDIVTNSSGNFSSAIQYNYAIIFFADETQCKQPITTNGVFANLTFKIKAVGTTWIDFSEIGSFCDRDMIEIPVSVSGGYITTEAILPTATPTPTPTPTPTLAPIPTPIPFVTPPLITSQINQIAAGGEHTIALEKDGTVVAWGNNNFGQCNVPTGLRGVKAISAGYGYTVALKEDGTVVAWGYNYNGECNVPTGLNNVKAVAAGTDHTVALKEDGTVVAWGLNDFGQCNVPAGLNGVKAIAAGGLNTVALKEDGTVVAWGLNDFGQCNVPAGLNGVKAISAGYGYTVALKEDGTVVAWGINYYGECKVPTGLICVKGIAAWRYHTVALKEDGTVVAWGYNYSGQCNVPTGLSSVKAIAAGGDHTVALKEDGTVVAWGYNYSGQCNVPITPTPPSLPVLGSDEVHVDTGNLTDVTVNIGSNILTSIQNGIGTLNPVIDYRVSKNTVTINKQYLIYYFTKFPDQNLYLNFNYSNGNSAVLTIYTGNSPHVVLSPSAISYDLKLGDAQLNFVPNGNFIAGIKSGDYSLVQRIDYTYSPLLHILYIRKGYLNTYFSKNTEPLKLTVYFTGDIPKTIVLNPVKYR